MNWPITFLKIFLVLSAVSLMNCHEVKNHDNLYWLDPITKMKFVLIPKGTFTMGNKANDDNQNYMDSKPHSVIIENDFWIGITEVTQQQWQKIMGKEELHPYKPSPFRNQQPNYPVVSVSYYEVQKFIEKLNLISENSTYRLPTEAEWEYACRAKTTGPYYFGDVISDSLANYNAQIKYHKSKIGSYIGHPTAVASYPANGWGLYDMHGNVWEWVSDWYAPYQQKSLKNPSGPQDGSLKIIRGGSWYFGAENAQSSFRRTHDPNTWGFSIGFRLVRESL